MTALTGKQTSLSVRGNQDMLTRERGLAAGVGSTPPMSGHVVFDDAVLRITPTRTPPGLAVSGKSSSPTILHC
jgi:hypothetical protein